MRVDFYHLTEDPVAAALCDLAGKVLSAGQRLLVVCEGDEARAVLSEALWAAPGFIANGESGQDGAAEQPVLLARSLPDGAPANGARIIAYADGAWRDPPAAFDRALHLFDEATIEAARQAWRSLDEAERHYWKKENGRWGKML